MTPRRRFEFLERSRPAPAGEEPPASLSRRFENLEERSTGRAAASTIATEARFDPSAPPAAAVDAPLFVRCLDCGADNRPRAAACFNCEASLETAEQRSFNTRFWIREREEIDRSVEEGRKQVRAEVEEKLLQARKRAQAGASIREELESGAGEDETVLGRPSLGLRLLRWIRDPRLRALALAGVIAAPLLLMFGAKADSGLQGFGILLALVIGVLFWPPGLWSDH